MPNFCRKCGNQLLEDSLFCEKCGTLVKTEATVPITPSPTPPIKVEQPRFTLSRPIQAPQPKHTSPFKPVVIIGIAVIAIIALGGSIAIWEWGGWNYEYLGDNRYTIDSKEVLNIDLEIDNSAGNVNIEYVDSTILFNATIRISGKEGDDINEAETFEEYTEGNNLVVKFNDDENGGFFDFGKPRFQYELLIYIAKEVKTNLNVDVSSGDISVICTESTTFTWLHLYTSSGKIFTNLGSSTVDCPEISLGTSSGNILVQSVNLIIQQDVLWVIDSSSGNVLIQLTDLIVQQDVSWAIGISSGNLMIELNQNIQQTTQALMDFDIETSSGNVKVDYQLHSTVGIRIDADVSSGDIDLPNGGSSYSSTNYGTAELQLDFTIDVSSGNIDVNAI